MPRIYARYGGMPPAPALPFPGRGVARSPSRSAASLNRDRNEHHVWYGPGSAAHRSARATRCAASGARRSTSARHGYNAAFSKGGFNGRVTILAEIARDLFQLTISVDPDFVQTRKLRKCQVSFLRRQFART